MFREKNLHVHPRILAFDGGHRAHTKNKFFHRQRQMFFYGSIDNWQMYIYFPAGQCSRIYLGAVWCTKLELFLGPFELAQI